MRALKYSFYIFICLILFASCSTKKNTPASRNWQAFTTRYNVYFNGHEHYVEQLQQMEHDYEDDYSRRLYTHPAEARADQKMPQPSGDFKRTIEKMQKAIQLHSIKKKPAKRSSSPKEKAFRARDEFNPFLHNAWLTMGKGQYLNGDFSGAAATFMYISKHFTWLPKVVTEARIWQALCYCALDWNYEAENTLHLVKQKDLTTSELKNLYNRAQADYLIRTDRYAEAIPFLRYAASHAKGTQRNRLWFLLGQLYSNIKDSKNAYSAFKNAGKGQGISYRAKFNARIRQSEVYTGKNISKEVASLKAMTRYARNEEFADQIYYAIGNLYLSKGDTLRAVKNYREAVEKSTRNGIDRALALLALGNIYFTKGDYVKAQPCYSEAIPQLPDNYPDYKTLKTRSDILDELAIYDGNVQLQDSLLQLADMTPQQQLEAAQKKVKELLEREKRKAEETKREEAMQEREGMEPQGIQRNDAAPQGFIGNTDKSWYFYNAMTKAQGKTEFQRRWGARRLEDDWRRRNKTSYSIDTDEENTETDADNNITDNQGNSDNDSGGKKENAENTKKGDASDPHNVEYYLSQIPSTPEERKNANDIIQEGLYNMGLILKDKLEDYTAAKKEFLRLEEKYPDNVYRLDVYYNLYLMAVRNADTAEAEHWRQKILSDFPQSPYGLAMRDPNYFDNLRHMNSIQEDLYDKAYSAYLDNNNREVHELTAEMEKDYPLSKILPKFVFIDALSYLTDNDNDKFKKRLETLLERWPDTDMTPMAANILKGLKAGRVPHSGNTNSTGMLWSLNLTDNDSTAMGADGQPANFERDPDSPQYLVLAFPRDSVNANELLYEVARFNFSSFVIKDFDLEQMSFGEIGLLLVKGFENLRELEHYRSVMERSNLNLPPDVRPIMISRHNFELLLNEGRSFEEYFRFEAEPPAPANLPEPTPPDVEETEQQG